MLLVFLVTLRGVHGILNLELPTHIYALPNSRRGMVQYVCHCTL